MMNLKMITFLSVFAITSRHIHYVEGVRTPTLMRSNSTPNLRLLSNVYNETSTETTSNTNKEIITCEEYKKNIYNRYKRNTYLRSKERYTFDNK